MAKHAELSPSSAHRWMHCTGSVQLVRSLPVVEGPNPAADEGTFAHSIAAECLSNDTSAESFTGWKATINGVEYVCDEEMAQYIQIYVDSVRHFAHGGTLLVEQSLPLTDFTAEEDAHGTADAIVMRDGVLQIHDLKYGRNEVMADDNEQLLMYAVAALNYYSEALGPFHTVEGFIHQPRIWHEPKVATFTIAELKKFTLRVAEAALAVHNSPKLVAGDKQCRYCPAQPVCPELRRVVNDRIMRAFDDDTQADQLADAMKYVDLAEAWAKATRAEVERRLLAGRPIPGFKLVQGRKGNRRWNNEGVVETELAMALGEDAYDMKLISVAEAEKRLKKTHPTTWLKVAELVSQSDGKASVAPESDPRPAITAGVASIDDFV